MFDRQEFVHRVLASLLTTASLVATMLAGTCFLQAQTIVPNGTNLAMLPAPVASDVWNLQGNATLFDPAATASSFAVVLPVGTPGLTINGVASGSTVTLNDGAGHFGFFNNATASAITLNLSDVTITGGLRTASAASGGAIASSGALTLNTSGAVTLSNNETTATNANGGAIAASPLTINGNNTTLAITSNTAGVNGGAVVSGNVTLAGSYNSIFIANNSNSTAGGSFNGGAFLVQGVLTISAAVAGDFTVADDTEASNGTFWVSQGVIIAPTTTVGGTMAFTGDAGNAGGAIYTDSAITIGGSYGNILMTGNTGRAGRGGAFRAASGITIDTTVSGTMVVTGNSAVGDGGALVATGGFVTITGSYGGIDFNHNTSGTDATGTLAVPGVQCSGGGGAICAGNGNLTISATVADTITFADNTAVRGNGGALAANNGNVILDAGPGNISLTGNIAVGTTVAGNGGAIYSTGSTTINGGTVTLSGNSAGALGALGGAIFSFGAVTINGSEITVVNNTAGGAGGAIDAGGDVLIGNAGSTNRVTLSGNSAGDLGGAIVGGAVTISGSIVTLDHNSAHSGGGAIAGGPVVLTGALTITDNTAGQGSGGAISGGDVTLNATGESVLSGNTAGRLGGAIAGGDVTLNATGGDITFSGNTESTNTTAQANAMFVSGTTTFNALAGRSITFFDPVQSNAANGLVTVTKTGAGAVAFDGSLYTNPADRLSQVYADTTVQEGTFAVRNNAIYGALAADVDQAAPSSFTVDSGATLAGGIAGEVRADDFALNGTLNIAGAAPPGNASGGFSTFTVTSNNVKFGAGSQVLFNTYLNDASVQRTDLLTLNLNGSATSGTADMRVTNVGGPGGLTTGNGIQLVQVTGNNGTTAGAFTLAGPVVAGPYDYTLFHGSVDASGPQNWYLRSTLDCSLAPNAEVCAPPTPPTPPTPPAPPHFRIETSLNAALPAIALLYGRNLLDTLHERVGDEEDIRGVTGLYQNAPYTGGWARLIGTGGKEQGDPRGIFGAGPEFSYGFLGLQGGQDLLRREHDDGSRDHAGVTFAVGSAQGDVTHFDGTRGDDDFQAYTLGGYWTHFGAPGWYVDMMLQGTFYDVRTSANRGLIPFTTNGDGIAGSVEAGYPFRFANGYFIEPQAQLIYQNINFNSALDNGALVKFSNVDSLLGRIGARFGRTWSLDGNAPDARLITVWIRPNVWQEFRGNPITQFSSEDGFMPFRADLGGTWGEINVGVSGQVNLNTTLFANASYQARFDGKGFAYDGKAGVRVNW